MYFEGLSHKLLEIFIYVFNHIIYIEQCTQTDLDTLATS